MISAPNHLFGHSPRSSFLDSTWSAYGSCCIGRLAEANDATGKARVTMLKFQGVLNEALHCDYFL